jgi:hypothetical protein
MPVVTVKTSNTRKRKGMPDFPKAVGIVPKRKKKALQYVGAIKADRKKNHQAANESVAVVEQSGIYTKPLVSKKQFAPKTAVTNFTENISIKHIEAAGKDASAEAMDMMGFTLIEEKGWLVQKFSDGSKIKMSKI